MKISWQFSTASSGADRGIHQKILGSETTAQIISNDEVEDIMKILKSLEGSGLLLQAISEAIQNEAREQIGGFIGALLHTLDEVLLPNMLTGQKTAEATTEFICNKIEDKITIVSKKSSKKLYLQK